MALAASLASDLTRLLGAANVITGTDVLKTLCKDYSWFSPIVESEVAKWPSADVAVTPRNSDQALAVVELAARHRIPLTVRGAGTGNYGQAVPTAGGILLLTSGLTRVLSFGEASVSVESGVRLSDLERQARKHGLELRIYPSTYLTSSAAGFVAGGAGGVGSVTWGTLRDGNVLDVTLVTMHEQPRIVRITGDELSSVIHAFGTTGLLTEVTLALAPAVSWEQCVLAFESFADAYRFGRAVCEDDAIPKRLVSVHEWPIPRMFKTLDRAGGIAQDRVTVLVELGEGTTERAERIAAEHRGVLTWRSPTTDYHAPGRLTLSDFSFNHTMLWARRVDNAFTYLQVAFTGDSALDQLEKLHDAFPDLLRHVEFMRVAGRLGVVALPLVRFTSAERLYAIMAFCEQLGARVIDPHTWLLTVDPRLSRVPAAKAERDPMNLLNPGKVLTPEGVR
jgi:FAD/FMN-containing dehydrogenase